MLSTTHTLIYDKGKSITLEGVSRAGDKTIIMVKELNIIFDYGANLETSHSYDNILISHGHNDHIGQLHTHHPTRKLNKNMKEKIYVMPKKCIQKFQMIATCVSYMNCGRDDDCTKPFDDFIATRMIESEKCNGIRLLNNSNKESNYIVNAYAMTHKITCYGYIISMISKKLKDEYKGLKGDVLKTIDDKQKLYDCITPIIGYTGDTTITGVINNDNFLNVPILIMECTFFDSTTKEDALHGYHIHFDDIVSNIHLFKNKFIVLFHISQIYRTRDELQKIIDNSMIEDKSRIVLFY